MHRSSYLKMTAFRDSYLEGPRFGTAKRPEVLRVLDLGARAVRNQDSYRDLFSSAAFDYVGTDMEAGNNVDIVLADPHDWAEVESSSFDVVISGQTLEHDPEFWVTIAEVARVLRPNGLCCLIAPSTGPMHRYPLDCWRFYADAGPAMLSWAGLEQMETHVETKRWGKGSGIEWGDFMVIGRKPELSPSEQSELDTRLATIVSLGAKRSARTIQQTRVGSATRNFEAKAKVPIWKRCPYPVRAAFARTRSSIGERLGR
jgi:SAM-dependent methyltransferase